MARAEASSQAEERASQAAAAAAAAEGELRDYKVAPFPGCQQGHPLSSRNLSFAAHAFLPAL